MWNLIADCEAFMKFYNKYKNVYLYFNKENNKIFSVDIINNQSGKALTIEDLSESNLVNEIWGDYDIYEFIKKVLITEKER